MASRPWQIHLSTLILFVVLFGAILGMHVRPRVQYFDGPIDVTQYTQYGYPFIFSERLESRSANSSGGGIYFNPLAAFVNLLLILIPCLMFDRWISAKDDPEHRRNLLKLHVVPVIVSLSIGYAAVSANRNLSFDSKSTNTDLSGHYSQMGLISRHGFPQDTFHQLTGTRQFDEVHIYEDGLLIFAAKLQEGSFALEELMMSHADLTFSAADILRNSIGCIMIVFTTLVSSEWLWRRWKRKQSTQ